MLTTVSLRVVPSWIRRLYAGKTAADQARGTDLLAERLCANLARYTLQPREDAAETGEAAGSERQP